ncbi:hypothetical protein D7X33_37345, partial [Butyricicoccus sp. 1XD8-22]
NNRFIVDSEVILRDPATKFEFSNKYMLVIKRKDQRYVVESLNDEKHVDAIIQDYIDSLGIEESSDNNDQVKNEDEDFNYQKEDSEDLVDGENEQEVAN